MVGRHRIWPIPHPESRLTTLPFTVHQRADIFTLAPNVVTGFLSPFPVTLFLSLISPADFKIGGKNRPLSATQINPVCPSNHSPLTSPNHPTNCQITFLHLSIHFQIQYPILSSCNLTSALCMITQSLFTRYAIRSPSNLASALCTITKSLFTNTMII